MRHFDTACSQPLQMRCMCVPLARQGQLHDAHIICHAGHRPAQPPWHWQRDVARESCVQWAPIAMNKSNLSKWFSFLGVLKIHSLACPACTHDDIARLWNLVRLKRTKNAESGAPHWLGSLPRESIWGGHALTHPRTSAIPLSRVCDTACAFLTWHWLTRVKMHS